MKDDYRWYNSCLFDQRNQILKNHTELTPQIYNNKGLKPFLEKPAHLVQQETLRNKTIARGDKGETNLSNDISTKQNESQRANANTSFSQGPSIGNIYSKQIIT